LSVSYALRHHHALGNQLYLIALLIAKGMMMPKGI